MKVSGKAFGWTTGTLIWMPGAAGRTPGKRTLRAKKKLPTIFFFFVFKVQFPHTNGQVLKTAITLQHIFVRRSILPPHPPQPPPATRVVTTNNGREWKESLGQNCVVALHVHFPKQTSTSIHKGAWLQTLRPARMGSGSFFACGGGGFVAL